MKRNNWNREYCCFINYWLCFILQEKKNYIIFKIKDIVVEYGNKVEYSFDNLFK